MVLNANSGYNLVAAFLPNLTSKIVFKSKPSVGCISIVQSGCQQGMSNHGKHTGPEILGSDTCLGTHPPQINQHNL